MIKPTRISRFVCVSHLKNAARNLGERCEHIPSTHMFFPTKSTVHIEIGHDLGKTSIPSTTMEVLNVIPSPRIRHSAHMTHFLARPTRLYKEGESVQVQTLVCGGVSRLSLDLIDEAPGAFSMLSSRSPSLSHSQSHSHHHVS